jgi:radical SAM protein with 4Fe4S-binding SPASM domain
VSREVELHQLTRAKKPSPQKHLNEFHFEIVRGCQLKCRGCPVAALQPKVGRIDVEVFGRCLDNVDVDSVRNFRLFNYGEPLLHHDLPGILAKVAAQPWTAELVEISTNAQLVNWEAMEEALRMGVITRMVASCDGDSTPQSYEELRPPARWEKLIEFLRRMRELRDRVAPGMQLMTRTIVPDWDDRARWDELLIPMGWTPEYRHYSYFPESPENMTGRKLEPGKGPCFFLDAVDQLYVDADGLVVPCCIHSGAGGLGDLRERTYNEIVMGQRRARFVREMETHREGMHACSTCEFNSPAAMAAVFDPDGAMARQGSRQSE